MPEIIFVIRIALGDDKKDLALARNKIIKTFPIIGTAKEVVEIMARSVNPISVKLKKLGNSVR